MSFSWDHPKIYSISPAWYPWILFIQVVSISICIVLSAMSTMVAFDLIAGELSFTKPQTIWLTTIYMLGSNITSPISVHLAKRYGTKNIYCLAVIIFTSSALILGGGHTFETIFLSRFLEGVGGGLIFPIGLGMVVSNCSPTTKKLMISLYTSLIFGAGVGLGLPLSGYIAEHFSWRYLFHGIAPFGIFSLLLCALIQKETPKEENLPPIDYLGWFLYGCTVSSLIVAIALAPLTSTNEGWQEPFIQGCLLLFVLSFLAFLIVEKRHINPVIPLPLFRSPFFMIGCVAIFLLGSTIFASISTTMTFMLHGLFFERLVAAKIGMIYGLTFAAVTLISNVLIEKKFPIYVLVLSGIAILVLSYLLNNTFSWQTSPAQIYPILILRGIGLGITVGPITIAALQGVPKIKAATATTILTTFRQMGAAYGGVLISWIQIKREIFHTARFAEGVDPNHPTYQVTEKNLLYTLNQTGFSSHIDPAKRVQLEIISNLKIQSFIQSQNDAMMVFGAVVFAIGLIVLFLVLHSSYRKKHDLETPP